MYICICIYISPTYTTVYIIDYICIPYIITIKNYILGIRNLLFRDCTSTKHPFYDPLGHSSLPRCTSSRLHGPQKNRPQIDEAHDASYPCTCALSNNRTMHFNKYVHIIY